MNTSGNLSAAIANNPAITATLAREAAARRFEALPADAVALAQQCLLDWFGVTLLGSREPLTNILIGEALDRGSAGVIPVIGRHDRLNLLDAALANGGAAHALDYDDGNRAGGHLSAPIISALMALAYHTQASGKDVITAFVAGYELCARIGYLLQPNHYARGFHPTATLGTFGATAAVAHLLNLDAAQTEMALGIAASQAAGLVGNFGTMCKPMHVGRAAMNGLQAARLAARGFTARVGLLEHASGFAAAHSSDFHTELALAVPARDFHLLANVFKFHAACAGTHSTIDALNELRIHNNLQPDQIERVIVRMSPRLDRVCNIAEPRTGMEIKFSLRMTAALALAGIDTADPVIFTDALTHSPALVSLRDRVVVTADESILPMDTHVEIVLRDGRMFSAVRAGDQPEADIAVQGERVHNKFQRLALPIIGAARTSALAQRIKTIHDETHINELMDLAVPA